MDHIWTKSYPHGAAPEINPQAYTSLLDVFYRSVGQYSEKPALSNFGTVLSFQEWQDHSHALATYFQKVLRLPQGTRIALMLPNVLQYPIAIIGAFMAGLVVVNVNPLYTERELEHQLVDSGAEVILVLENFAHKIEHILPKTALKHVIITKIGDLFPFPKNKLFNFFMKYVKHQVPAWKIYGEIAFADALEIGRNNELEPIELLASDVAFLQYTGGTTGIAKGAILTHANMVANLEQVSSIFRFKLNPGKETIITALPLYHIFSLTANCLLFMKYGSLNVLITNPRDIKGLVEEIKRHSAFSITGVNTLFNALLHEPSFKDINFKGLNIALGGGTALHPKVAAQWKQTTGKSIIEAYGLTEASPAVCINPYDLDGYNGSVGLPVPSTDIAILDDNENELPLGEAGELCIKGPQVMQGYWNHPEEDAKVFTTNGWLRTGDIAKIDEKGFVYIIERKKDLIIVSGFNVYPTEVEEVLTSHPDIVEAAVVSVTDEHSGEVVKAFIVPETQSLTKEAVIQYCREQLTAYKIPKYIEFVKELPKSNVGKILRKNLRN